MNKEREELCVFFMCVIGYVFLSVWTGEIHLGKIGRHLNNGSNLKRVKMD